MFLIDIYNLWLMLMNNKYLFLKRLSVLVLKKVFKWNILMKINKYIEKKNYM